MASIRSLPSGRYRVRWRGEDGREHGATAPTKKAALELKAKAELDAFRGRTLDPTTSRMAFGDYFAEVMAEADDLRSSTTALYESVGRRFIVPQLGSTSLNAIDARAIGRLYAGLKKQGVGTPTLEVVHRLLSRVLRQAAREGLIPASPASVVRSPRAIREPPRVLSITEVARLAFVLGVGVPKHQGVRPTSNTGSPGEREEGLRAWLAHVEEFNPTPEAVLRAVCGYPYVHDKYESEIADLSPYGAMALLGAFAGLRFGEVAALRASSFDLAGSSPVVHVREALTEVSGVVAIGPPKTPGSVRAVPIVEPAANRIRELVGDAVRFGGAGRDELLFRSPGGGPLSPTRWRARVWRRAVTFLQMSPPPTFHDLRHTYASLLIASNLHPKVVQELMGHASIRTTMDVYGHLMEGVTHDQVAALERRLSGT